MLFQSSEILSVFNFPFEIKGIAEYIDKSPCINNGGDYERVNLGDNNGGYVSYNGSTQVRFRDNISCSSAMYDATTKLSLVIASNYNNVEQVAMAYLNKISGAVVTEIITNRERIIREEVMGDVQLKLVKINFEYTFLYVNGCEDELECDC